MSCRILLEDFLVKNDKAILSFKSRSQICLKLLIKRSLIRYFCEVLDIKGVLKYLSPITKHLNEH